MAEGEALCVCLLSRFLSSHGQVLSLYICMCLCVLGLASAAHSVIIQSFQTSLAAMRVYTETDSLYTHMISHTLRGHGVACVLCCTSLDVSPNTYNPQGFPTEMIGV